MNKQPSKQLSLRIPFEEYEELRIAAEAQNMTVSDVTKHRLKKARNCMSTQEMLRMTEARLKRLIFNMTCSVAGLSDLDIVEAEKRFVDITKNGIKREN
jgi:uncharacterized protein (DUF1778 family)